jgi:hypothetical protein
VSKIVKLSETWVFPFPLIIIKLLNTDIYKFPVYVTIKCSGSVISWASWIPIRLLEVPDPGADPDPSIMKLKYYGNRTFFLFSAVLWILIRDPVFYDPEVQDPDP